MRPFHAIVAGAFVAAACGCSGHGASTTSSGPSTETPTVTAASCSAADVQKALGQAKDGETVVVPAGTCVWSTAVNVTNDKVTLQGAGEGATIIQSDVDGSFLTIALPAATSAFRLTGFTLEPAAGVTAMSGNAPIYVEGTCASSGCSALRFDHLALSGWTYTSYGASGNNFPNFMMRVDDVFGVMDHVTATFTADGELANVGYSSYLGVGQNGDGAWAAPDDFGTEKMFYIEDSTFTTTDTTAALTDTDNAPAGGGRFVVRHSTLTNFTVQTHGTESTGRPRGGRAFEIYGNTFNCSSSNGCQTINFRSGTALVWGNTINTPGGFINGFVSIGLYRTFADLGGWGWCDGTGSWDDDDGTVYDTGTITASTPTSPGMTSTVTDGSKSWAASQWVENGAPYSLVDVTQGFGYEIGASTADTITVVNAYQDYWNGPPTWAVGDTYQILRAKACIDQPGRGQGDLLSGDTPTPTGWAHEQISPIYEWGDTNSGTNYGGWIGVDTARIIADRDYFSQATPFDGSHGTGQGPLSARPSTCTPGVAYWATDESTLYQCSSASAWTAYYTPLPYPYPLDAEGYPAASK